MEKKSLEQILADHKRNLQVQAVSSPVGDASPKPVNPLVVARIQVR